MACEHTCLCLDVFLHVELQNEVLPENFHGIELLGPFMLDYENFAKRAFTDQLDDFKLRQVRIISRRPLIDCSLLRHLLFRQLLFLGILCHYRCAALRIILLSILVFG